MTDARKSLFRLATKNGSAMETRSVWPHRGPCLRPHRGKRPQFEKTYVPPLAESCRGAGHGDGLLVVLVVCQVSGLCEIRCEVGTHQGSGPRLVPLACPPSAMPALWGRRGHHWHLIATLWPMALQIIRFHVQAYLQYQGRLLRRNLRSPRLGASRHWSRDPFRETSLVSSASSWDLVSGCHDRRRMRLVFGRTLVLPQLR